MTRDFLISFFAGVAATVVTWIVVRFFAPSLRAWISKAPSIQGNWKYYDGEAAVGEPVGDADFRQVGRAITVKLTRRRSRTGDSYVRRFDSKGEYVDGCLQLAFEERDTRGASVGSLVLKLSSDNKTLNGLTMYFNRDKGEVVAHRIVFQKTV